MTVQQIRDEHIKKLSVETRADVIHKSAFLAQLFRKEGRRGDPYVAHVYWPFNPDDPYFKQDPKVSIMRYADTADEAVRLCLSDLRIQRVQPGLLKAISELGQACQSLKFTVITETFKRAQGELFDAAPRTSHTPFYSDIDDDVPF